jgi:hypothetical protein
VVDVLDLVLGIDFVVERLVPTAAQLASLDVFPFAAPDGAIDVRDLTVLAQAIVLGAWPDDVVPPLEPAAGPRVATSDGPFELTSEPIPGGLLLQATHDRPVRALQLSLRIDRPDALVEVMMEEVARGEAIALVHRIEASRLVRVLVYRIDGGSFAAGSYPLLRLSWVESIAPADLRYGVAVGEDLRRLPITLEGYTATGIEERPERPVTIHAPYPNPFAIGERRPLHIPLTLEGAAPVRIAVFDVLGREVALVYEGLGQPGAQEFVWAGPDDGRILAPGLYLIQVRAGAETATRPVLVR